MIRRDGSRKDRRRLFGIVAGSGLWTPENDPDLIGWWDVEDTSTLTILPAPDRITEIRNKVSGVGTDYGNGTAGQIPALVSVDGHDMANFDGINDWWAETSGNAGVSPGAGDFTVAMLLRVATTVSVTASTWINGGPGLVPTWFLTVRPTQVTWLIRDTMGTALIQAADETWQDGVTRWLLVAQRDNAANEIRLYYGSGPTLFESASSPVSIVAPITNLNSANSAIGSVVAGPSGLYTGDLGEWLVITRAMSASERSALAGYFARKWQLTGP